MTFERISLGIVLTALLTFASVTAEAISCPPKAGDGAKVVDDVDGDGVDDWAFPKTTEMDKKGNKIETFCLKGSDDHGTMFGSRYTDKKTGKQVWIGACVFDGGQNRRSKEIHKAGANKGNWKKIDWFNFEPPPNGNDDWHWEYDPATGNLVTKKTSGSYVLVFRNGKWYRVYVYTVDDTESAQAPEEFEDLSFDGGSIISLCSSIDCPGDSLGNIAAFSTDNGGGSWALGFDVPEFGGSGIEIDPIVGTIAVVTPGDTFSVGGELLQSASVSGDAATLAAGAWTVSSVTASEVTFVATVAADLYPGDHLTGFNVESAALETGVVPWDSAGADIGYAGCVPGPVATPKSLCQPAEFVPSESTFTLRTAALPSIVLTATPGSESLVQLGDLPLGHFVSVDSTVWSTLNFGPGTSLFTGIPLISNLLLSVNNEAGVLQSGFTIASNELGGGGSIGPVFGGLLGLTGQTVIQALGGSIQIGIPLDHVGGQMGETTMVTLIGNNITVTNGPFFTGSLVITGITSNIVTIPARANVQGVAFSLQPTPDETVMTLSTNGGFASVSGGFALEHHTVTVEGTNNLASGSKGGTVTVVSPLRIRTGQILGDIPSSVSLEFSFVPEPRAMLLLVSGAIGLAIMGRRRMRR